MVEGRRPVSRPVSASPGGPPRSLPRVVTLMSLSRRPSLPRECTGDGTSHITHHTAYVTCHMPHVTCHISHTGRLAAVQKVWARLRCVQALLDGSGGHLCRPRPVSHCPIARRSSLVARRSSLVSLCELSEVVRLNATPRGRRLWALWADAAVGTPRGPRARQQGARGTEPLRASPFSRCPPTSLSLNEKRDRRTIFF